MHRQPPAPPFQFSSIYNSYLCTSDPFLSSILSKKKADPAFAKSSPERTVSVDRQGCSLFAVEHLMLLVREGYEVGHRLEVAPKKRTSTLR